MKAKELLNNALKMLGYTNADGNAELTTRIRNSAIVTVNLVYSDLWKTTSREAFKSIKSLDDEILLPQRVTDECFLYGLAMHIARSENDGDQQQYFAHLYNAKRAGLTNYERVKNAMPFPEN